MECRTERVDRCTFSVGFGFLTRASSLTSFSLPHRHIFTPTSVSLPPSLPPFPSLPFLPANLSPSFPASSVETESSELKSPSAPESPSLSSTSVRMAITLLSPCTVMELPTRVRCSRLTTWLSVSFPFPSLFPSSSLSLAFAPRLKTISG